MAFVVYTVSGRIDHIYNGPVNPDITAPAGMTGVFIDGYVAQAPGLYYDTSATPAGLAQGTLVTPSLDKTAIASDGADTATLSGLPDPCWLLINNDEVQATGGTYKLTSMTAGRFLIRLSGAYFGGPWQVMADTLSNWQAAQNAMLTAAYQAAIAAPVSFTTAAGVTKTFQSDPGSVANLQDSLAGLGAVKATPAGFYWVSADNTQVPFTYADLQGLAAAMLAQGWGAFQNLQTRKAAVRAATTVAEIEAVSF